VLFCSNDVREPEGIATPAPCHPRPPARGLHVGVTGHRLNRISQHQLDQITPQIEPVLAHLASASRCIEPVLLSNLAEGSDRHLARLGLQLGYTLHAVLPRPRDDYARGFSSAASRREYRALLADAARITELRGPLGVAGRTYLRAGHALLDQADLLLALWDGAPSRGTGGTADVVDEAFRRRIPVLHLSTRPRQRPRLLWPRAGGTVEQCCDRRRLDAVLAHVRDTRR